jgi:glucose-1-phosphate adenylyltransferase
MARVLAVILGGGRGTRLYPLTKHRSKPAVPIGGRYRLIDIPISNCINSGVMRMFVLTQFQAFSLTKHVHNAFKFDSFSRGFVEIVAAEQRMDADDWYQGTADAVRRNLARFLSFGADAILVLSGDQLYRMDFRKLLMTHVAAKADITISVTPVARSAARRFGILRADRDGLIRRFVEKPRTPEDLTGLETPDMLLRGMPARGPRYLASMGIYAFRPEVLLDLLEESEAPDFGRDIIPLAIGSHRVFAHVFMGYWEDIGTIRSFHRANLDLSSSRPRFGLHDESAPVYTRARDLPGPQLARAQIQESILCEGSIIGEARIEHSVIGLRSRIGSGCRITDSVIMGADYFETPNQIADDRRRHIPNIGVGANTRIHRAIVDKDARIGDGVRILNQAGLKEHDAEGYSIREGIVVVHKGAVIPGGTRI